MVPRKLFINPEERTIGDGAPAALASSSSLFFNEDVEQIELYFFQYKSATSQEVEYLDYSANTVKVAIGVTAPAAIQTSWSAASTAVTASVTVLQAGNSSNSEVQQVSFSPAPQVGSFSLSFPSRNIAVSSITASNLFASSPHGLLDNQSITLTGFTAPSGFSNGNAFFVRDRTSNSFRLANTPLGSALTLSASSGGTAVLAAARTGLIAAEATEAQIQQAVDGAGLVVSGQSQVSVEGSANSFKLRYGGFMGLMDMPSVEVAENTLGASPHLQANLSLNTQNVETLLSEGQGDNCKLEIEIADGGLRQTYQVPVTISSDIISSSSPAPLPAITPASSFNLTAPNSDVWNVTIDNNGILTATKQ
jgi:hypothetical protein